MNAVNGSFGFDLPWEGAFGYSQGFRVESTLIIAGQLSHDLDGSFVHVNDFRGQVKQAFSNLDRVLQHYGARRDQIIETTIFVKQLPDHFADLAELHKAYFDGHRPVSNVLGVVDLALPDQLVEIAAHASLSE